MFTYYKADTYLEARQFAEFLWRNGFGAEVKNGQNGKTHVVGNDPRVMVFLMNNKQKRKTA